MKSQTYIISCLLLLISSCSPSLKNLISKSEAGKAIIQYENGKYSSLMSTREGFESLKSNQKLYLSPGRCELTEPIKVENLENIQVIGEQTDLVAKIDMPVITFRGIKNIHLSNLLIVHEIGGWCAQNCVEFYNSSDLNIKNCQFDGSGYFGLALTKVNTATIENNKFFNCEYGLAAWTSEGLLVKNNAFSKNRDQDIQVNNKAQFANDFEAQNTFE